MKVSLPRNSRFNFMDKRDLSCAGGQGRLFIALFVGKVVRIAKDRKLGQPIENCGGIYR